MKLIRKKAIIEMLSRMKNRHPLLRAKSIESLTNEANLSEETATAMAEQWNDLIIALSEEDDGIWQTKATNFGTWCATQKIPFETVMAQLHFYKRAATPIMVREYEGIEGYMGAHLALDEALTAIMGKIPLGYFGVG
jgi:hypothetical protein